MMSKKILLAALAFTAAASFQFTAVASAASHHTHKEREISVFATVAYGEDGDIEDRVIEPDDGFSSAE